MATIQKRPNRPSPYRVLWWQDCRKYSQSFRTLAEAKKFRAQCELQRQAIRTGSAELETAAALWIQDRTACCRMETVRRYLVVVRSFCEFCGPVRVDSVTVLHVEQWRNDRASRLEPNTVRNDIKCLRSFFAWCASHSLCSASPAARVSIPRFRRRIPGWLDELQTERLLDQLMEAGLTEYRLVCLLASRAGLRAREIRDLRWADVDLSAGILRINETKSRDPRIVPIHPTLASAILDWPESGPFVFPRIRKSAGGNTHRSTAQGKALNAWLHSCGWQITLHGLRHSFASQLAAAGASEEVLRTLLGHTSLEVTRLYTHSRDRDRTAAVMRLGHLRPERASTAATPDLEATTPEWQARTCAG
jgi:integrase/recombinase XerC